MHIILSGMRGTWGGKNTIDVVPSSPFESTFSMMRPDYSIKVCATGGRDESRNEWIGWSGN